MRLCKRLFIVGALILAVWIGMVIYDSTQLKANIIRFHVVANSDLEQDQAIKLQVRDAVNTYLKESLIEVKDITSAQKYLEENIPKITEIANRTLTACGVAPTAVVSYCKEAFESRVSESLKLPAGIYNTLRIVIGEGKGKNWWCVVYPQLCLPDTTEESDALPTGAGLPDHLRYTLTSNGEYEIRFLVLECFGKLEKLVFERK